MMETQLIAFVAVYLHKIHIKKPVKYCKMLFDCPPNELLKISNETGKKKNVKN